MMEREALKLALEALELHLTHHEHGCVYLDPAVTAIKEALAQPEQEAEWYHGVDQHGCNRFYHKTEVRPKEFSTHLYTTPPQPAHEQWNAALDHAAERIGEIKGFGQATQDSFAVFIQGLKK